MTTVNMGLGEALPCAKSWQHAVSFRDLPDRFIFAFRTHAAMRSPIPSHRPGAGICWIGRVHGDWGGGRDELGKRASWSTSISVEPQVNIAGGRNTGA